MRKSLTAAVAALTVCGTVAAAALPAQAQSYGYYGNGYDNGQNHRHHSNNTGAAVAAGVVGLALGAVLASSSNRSRGGYTSNSYYGGNGGSYYGGNGGSYYGDSYGSDRYRGQSYYADDWDGYGSSRGYQVCQTSRWVYDPYIGRRVQVRSTYAC